MGMVHPCGAMALPATLRAVSESSVGTELKWPFCDRCDRCGAFCFFLQFFFFDKKRTRRTKDGGIGIWKFFAFFKLDIDLESYDFVKRIHPPRKKHGTFSFVVGRRKSPKEKIQNIVSFPRHCPMRDAGENLGEHWPLINSPIRGSQGCQTRNSIEQLEDYIHPLKNQRLELQNLCSFKMFYFCLITE